MTAPGSAQLRAWFIEWDAATLHVTHTPCNGSHRIEQGPGSPLYLDTLDALTSAHECAAADADCADSEQLLIGGVHMTRAEYEEALPLAKHMFVTEWADDGLTWDDATRNEKAGWTRRARNSIKVLRDAGFNVSR